MGRRRQVRLIAGLRWAPRGLCLLALVAAMPSQAQNCGWSRVDHVVSYNASGVWNPTVYRSILGALSVAQVGGAVWEGAETRFGKTMWQGIDAQIIAGATAEVGKLIFTRARPDQGGNPCLWFQGGSYDSFPSGESALSAALVTPYVIEYANESPAAYALLLLPAYIGVARIKNQQHWQSDVLVGWAVGGLSGWLSHSLETPIMIRLLPGGFEVGLKMQF